MNWNCNINGNAIERNVFVTALGESFSDGHQNSFEFPICFSFWKRGFRFFLWGLCENVDERTYVWESFKPSSFTVDHFLTKRMKPEGDFCFGNWNFDFVLKIKRTGGNEWRVYFNWGCFLFKKAWEWFRKDQGSIKVQLPALYSHLTTFVHHKTLRDL